MMFRIQSIGYISDLGSTAAIDFEKYRRLMMEIVIVDRKFWMSHARREVADRLSVDSGEYLKISLAPNS